jgi:hypothetical protein
MNRKSRFYWINTLFLTINFLSSQPILAQSIVPSQDGTGTVVNQDGNYIEN